MSSSERKRELWDVEKFPSNHTTGCLIVCSSAGASGEEPGKEMGGLYVSHSRELDANSSGCRSVDLLASWKECLNFCRIG